MTPIIARDVELAAADRFLAALERGPASLVYEGEAGIGKTTIWSEAIRQAEARAFRVLVARPARPERELSLATLADLLGGLDPSAFDALPEPQRLAITGVLEGEQPGERAIQPRLLGIALRTLLETLARERAVVLAIDDVQWTDPVSSSAIGFALRRAGTSRIGFLGAQRSGEPVPDGLADPIHAARSVVGPMSVAGLHHIVRQELGETPARPTMVRVHAASGGNPLFALEIVRMLRDTGEPPADQPLPVPGDVRDLLAQRIRRLAPSVRETLLVAASLGQPTVTTLADALDRDVVPDLDAAEDEGLVSRDGNGVRFRHPLFGAAIAGHASPGERRRVHRALASVLAGTEEGARHGALAAEGRDAEVAKALEDAAEAAAHRGAPAAAVDLFEMAARLTPTDAVEDRERRTIRRGDETARSGDTERAIAILDEVVATSSSPTNRVKARLKLVSIRYDMDPDPSEMFEICEAALAEPIDDPGLLALAHATYAAAAWIDRERLVEHADEAMRILDSMDDPDPGTLGLAIMAKVEGDAGSGRRARPDPVLVERALAAERRAARPSVTERFSGALGVFLKYADDYEAARPWLELTLQTAIDEGDESGIPYALSHLPQLELWTGHWPKAEEYARWHLDISRELGLEFQRSTAVYNLAIVHVHQGRIDEARAELDPELAKAEADGNKGTESLLLATRCLLELSVGNLDAAALAGRRATAVRAAIGLAGRRRHDADLVEALVGLGDVDGAAAYVREADADEVGDLPTTRALALRSRALVEAARGDTDAAIASLEAALAEHERAVNPFDRARTRLVLGQVRRRRRERRLAREALDASLAELEQLGSPLWAAKAREELDRLGFGRATAEGELTEMERRVAELAARGLTNKEVAAQLVISTKTVEAHLARAYAKLGIASRAELGARLGASPQESAQTS